MRCDLSNEESYDLLSVYMTLHVKFNEPIVKASGNGSLVSPGNLVYNRIWPIGIAKIDAGKTFSFYAYTSGRYMVYATFLEAMFTSLDMNKQEQLRLVLTNWQALSFEPKL